MEIERTPAADLHPPTMSDVAARVGLSRQSVSLVFRNAPGVSAGTRQRVFQAADDLGYRPDIAAQMLRKRDSQHIGVLITASHAFEQDLIESLYAVADELGYVLMLTAVTRDRDENLVVSELLGYRPGALILIGGTFTNDSLQKLARHVSVVQVGTEQDDPGVDTVLSDGKSGISKAVAHLISLGHTDIAFLDGGAMPGAAKRRNGYVSAMRKAGLQVGTILHGDYSEESGSRAARALLLGETLPTAVVASNDQMAAGLMMTLLRAGVALPEEVSVTGYDDSWLARLSYIDLTTVRQDSSELATVALNAAADRIVNRRRRPRQYVLLPELVIRGSTAPPGRPAGDL